MHRRKAFTILEILTVVAVIAILLGLLFFGLRKTGDKARDQSTRQALGNAKALLAEYDALVKVRSQSWGQTGTSPPADPALTAPGNVTTDGPDRNGAAVAATRNIMSALQSVPSNKAALAKINHDQLLKEQNPGDAPVLLDGWGNPIILVPANGLKLSSGIVTSPDGRPFFASAGPDGNFDKGDDNIYSFGL